MSRDALAQLNEDEAQLYIKSRYPGFENRFIKPVAPRAPARFTTTWSPATRPRTPGASTRSASRTSSTPCVSTARWHGIAPSATRAGSLAIAGCSRRAQRRTLSLDAPMRSDPPSPTPRQRPPRRHPATNAARRQPAAVAASSRVSRHRLYFACCWLLFWGSKSNINKPFAHLASRFT